MKFATASVLAALWLASGPALAGPAGGAASAAYKDIVPKLVMVSTGPKISSRATRMSALTPSRMVAST